MIKTRNVGKEGYRNYLRKADEYAEAMQEEYAQGRFNTCTLCAIHCGISAADALTIFFKGVRHAGERHEDVVQLIETLDLDKEIIKAKVRQLLNILTEKNRVEYEEKLTTESGAAMAVKNAERFLFWVKSVLPTN